jgi:hypothetical protein
VDCTSWCSANSIAQQARGGLPARAEKGLQDDASLSDVEHIGLDGPCDRPEDVIARFLSGCFKLIDDPRPDVCNAHH